MIAAYLFDMDGLLLDTERLARDNSPVAGEDIELTAFRQDMLEQVDMGRGHFAYGGVKAKQLDRLPARFGTVF